MVFGDQIVRVSERNQRIVVQRGSSTGRLRRVSDRKSGS